MEEKKYIRNFTEEARAKQKEHLSQIRQKAMEKKREMKEITLKAKLMKLEPKIELAKQYDEYVSNRIAQPQPQPQPEQEEEIIEVQKPKPKPKKKIIYQEVEEEEEEEQIVYVKKNKPKPQESLNSTLYKSSQETLFNRAIEERIRANLTGFYSAMLPREY
jgi:outer membrane biosynthesis protein TonB